MTGRDGVQNSYSGTQNYVVPLNSEGGGKGVVVNFNLWSRLTCFETNQVVYLPGTDVKYNRNDTSSPVASTLTAGPHGQQAPFINTHAQLHPFGYAGNLAFYHGGGMIGGFAAPPYTTQMYQVCSLWIFA